MEQISVALLNTISRFNNLVIFYFLPLSSFNEKINSRKNNATKLNFVHQLCDGRFIQNTLNTLQNYINPFWVRTYRSQNLQKTTTQGFQHFAISHMFVASPDWKRVLLIISECLFLTLNSKLCYYSVRDIFQTIYYPIRYEYAMHPNIIL